MAALPPPLINSSKESGHCAPPPTPAPAKSPPDKLAPPPRALAKSPPDKLAPPPRALAAGATRDQNRPIAVKSSSVEEEDDDDDVEQIDEDQPLFLSAFLHSNSSWLTSLVVHTSLLILLACLVTPTKSKELVRLLISQSKISEDLDVLDEKELDTELDIEDLSVDFESIVPDPDFLEPESFVLNDNPGGPIFEEFTLPIGNASSLYGGVGTGIGGTGPGDLDAFDRRLAREGGRSGDVQISLLWNNYNDLDLHVKTPSGEVIYFENERSACRGRLDVDANVSPETEEPVENIYWPKRQSPKGEYVVMVDYFRRHAGIEDATYFEVRVQVDGYVQTYTGNLSDGDAILEIVTFDRETFGEHEEDWEFKNE